jgi:glyoxylase-like metal-dependent hydrolase (beta-lactamase superfamily II)
MVAVAGFRIGDVTLTRVPYFDVALDAGLANLTTDEIAGLDWATPTWANDEGQVVFGVAVWLIESRNQLIVVDPCGAADGFLRSGPEAIGHQEAVLQALKDAGLPADRVDVVVLSHLEGIGMAAVVEPDGSWAPAFPNARIVITKAELEYISGPEADKVQGIEAFRALVELRVVDGVDDVHAITDAVTLVRTGGHSPGHAVVQVRSGGDRAVFIGHLAVSPMHMAIGDPTNRHLDPVPAERAFRELLAEARDDDALVVGPLFPFPGAGYVIGDRFEAAAD